MRMGTPFLCLDFKAKFRGHTPPMIWKISEERFFLKKETFWQCSGVGVTGQTKSTIR